MSAIPPDEDPAAEGFPPVPSIPEPPMPEPGAEPSAILTPPPADNQRIRALAYLSMAASTAPADDGEIDRLAARLGWPTAAVRADHVMARRLLHSGHAKTALDEAPTMKAWLATDPDNAVAAYDDLRPLARSEGMLRQAFALFDEAVQELQGTSMVRQRPERLRGFVERFAPAGQAPSPFDRLWAGGDTMADGAAAQTSRAGGGGQTPSRAAPVAGGAMPRTADGRLEGFDPWSPAIEPDTLIAALAPKRHSNPFGIQADKDGSLFRWTPPAPGPAGGPGRLRPEPMQRTAVSRAEKQMYLEWLVEAKSTNVFGKVSPEERDARLNLELGLPAGVKFPEPKVKDPGINGRGYRPAPGDRELLARAIFAETGIIPADSEAVGWTIVNRIGRRQYRETLDAVIRQPSQYAFLEVGDGPTGNSAQWRLSAHPETMDATAAASWQRALSAADGIVNGTTPDPTGGATFHFASNKYTGDYWTAPNAWFQSVLRDRKLVGTAYTSQSATTLRNYFFVEAGEHGQ